MFLMITFPSHFLILITDCQQNIISYALLTNNDLISLGHPLSKSFPSVLHMVRSTAFLAFFYASRNLFLLVFPCLYFNSLGFSLTILLNSRIGHVSLRLVRPFVQSHLLLVASCKAPCRTLQ